jgi:uncharacterized membrane protein
MASPAPLPARLRFGPALLLAVLVFGLVEIGVLDYAYARIGLDPHLFGALLGASLLGSLINLPLVELSAGEAAPAGVGGARPEPDPERPVTPARTLLAVNVGGAIVPTALSLYLAASLGIGLLALIAGGLVAAVTHRLAVPVPGVGIAVPVLVPPLVAAAAALFLDPSTAPALAYAAGTFGTLVGADLTNLGRLRALGAPVVSIGGAGTFDGIFLTGLLAVLLA